MLKLPPLFKNKKEFIVVSLILVAIIAARLLLIYQDYTKLKNLNSYYYTTALVERIYPAQNGSTLLKLKDKRDLEFYLFSKKKPPKKLEWIKVKIKPKNDITFIEYLKGFSATGEVLEKVADGFDPKAALRAKIEAQHTNDTMKSFYSAIFLADPLPKEIREAIANLGSSHLVALSGFHLGIIWLIVFGVLFYPYKILQKQLFPWRNINIDLGLISLIILALFVLYVGYPPTLIRAYIMLLIGWILLVLGLELVSFELLTFAALLIIAISPKLIISVGFWLSIIGVFYIFLMLKWLKNYPSWFLTLFAIPVGIFILMFPIAHYFFGSSTPWQLLSAPLSVIFIVFYPIIALLHFFNLGWIFDKEILWLLNLPKKSVEVSMPIGLISAYIVSSILSIFNKKVFYFTILFALLITGYFLYLSI